jgi:hypothetical protein
MAQSREISGLRKPGAENQRNREDGYSFRVVSVIEAVENAVAGQWDVPEFQREFVWKPSQVCGLADSLWREYPIGPMLLWRAGQHDHSESSLWIADGQQRLTALCLLLGQVPSWFARKPDEFRSRVRQRFDVRFDIAAHRGPRFVIAGEPRHDRESDPRLIPTGRLMAIDPGTRGGSNDLEHLVRDLKDAGCCRHLDEAQIRRRLLRVSLMRRREVVATLVNHRQRDDVLEIFERLNSRGMRFRGLLLKLLMEEIPAAIRGIKGRYQP